MSETISRTPEERQKLIDEVTRLNNVENITIRDACKKIGITYFQWHYWTKGKKRTPSKTGKRRRKNKPVLVTELVPSIPQTNERISVDFGNDGKRPTASQVADLLAQMNATSLRTLLQERS